MQSGKLTITKVTLEELTDQIESSDMSNYVDLGTALLVQGCHSVTGDFIGISSTEGKCAIIKI